MDDSSLILYGVVALLSTLYFIPQIVKAFIFHSKLRSIPTVGPSGILSSYIGAYRFFFNARDIIQEGYDKYYGTAFKIPRLFRWMIVVSGPNMIDDLRKAPDEQLSFMDAVNETVQMDYTIGPEIRKAPFHIATVRSPLTRNLAVRFGEVQDEIAAAYADLIPATEKEWLDVSAYTTIMQVVCRTSNRLFVGLPLCRNQDYRTLNQQFTIDVIKGAHIISLFPSILKPIAARIFTNLPGSIRRAERHLGSMIQERLDKEEEYGGDWPDKPNDLISWLLDDAKGEERTVRQITIRILAINFAAIHTTTMGFTHALYDLALLPKCAAELRAEVQAIISEDGWTKVAMGKMRKLDSFLRESQRVTGIGAITMERLVLKDFTFSNGIVIPAGNVICVASYGTHHDEANYENPEEFNPFRFSDLRAEDGESIKHQAVTLANDWLPFGIGRHACPGRFFAVNEMKAMLAHLLLTYDVKFKQEDVRPANQWYGGSCTPNTKAEVMFRKRTS